jgi:cell division protein ZapA
MAVVTLRIGDGVHEVSCRDGGEARLEQAGRIVDEYWDNGRRAAGGQGGGRALLLTALMIADALIEEREAPPPETPETAILNALADRVEKLAQALEEDAPRA